MAKIVLAKLTVHLLLLLYFVGNTKSYQPQRFRRRRLNVAYQWSQIEFLYPSEFDRENDIATGTFVPGSAAPIDVDVYYHDAESKSIFVTMPRTRQNGVPVTLGTITGSTLWRNPIIAPYPSWSWHRNPEQCKFNRIVSVYRIKIDECGRLWVLDSGRVGNRLVCPPQILAFNLTTRTLIRQYTIPRDQYEERSIFVTPIVDVRDSGNRCRDTFLYLADCQTFSIVVYDVEQNISWRVTDKTFYPYPNFGTYTILGESFELMDGILGMDLEPYARGRDRKLFYHAMSSSKENWVYASDLRNSTRFVNNSQSSPEIFHVYRGERPSQSPAMAIDSRGTAYFGIVSLTSVNCWNTQTEYGLENIDVIEQNSQTLQFASGVKIIKNPNGEESLWVVTNRFQKVARGNLSAFEVNFRILEGNVNNLVYDTRCDQNRLGLYPYTSNLPWSEEIKEFKHDLFDPYYY